MPAPKDLTKRAEWLKNLSTSHLGKKHVMKQKKYPKMSASKKGKHYPKIGAALTGKLHLPKHNAAIAASLTDKPKSPGHCTAISTGKRKYYAEHPGVCALENNGNWNDASSFKPYDQFWTPEFRESIRVRDNNTCQLCGKTQEQEFEEFGQKLSVHHCLYGKITKDDVFVTLCKKCNGKVNKKSEKEFWTGFFQMKTVLQQSNGIFNAFGMPVAERN